METFVRPAKVLVLGAHLDLVCMVLPFLKPRDKWLSEKVFGTTLKVVVKLWATTLV